VGVTCLILAQVVRNITLRHCQSPPRVGSETVCGYANATASNAAIPASVAMKIAKTFRFRPAFVIGSTPVGASNIGLRRRIACEVIHNFRAVFLSHD
jgi:hypothetical protein